MANPSCRAATLTLTLTLTRTRTQGVVTQRDAKAPDAALVLNEFIPFVADWCDPGNPNPNLNSNSNTNPNSNLNPNPDTNPNTNPNPTLPYQVLLYFGQTMRKG